MKAIVITQNEFEEAFRSFLDKVKIALAEGHLDVPQQQDIFRMVTYWAHMFRARVET
jgi:hypothetical protein